MSWGGESVFVVYAMRSYPPPTPIRPAEDRYGNKGRRCSGGARGLLSRGRPARLARAKVGFSGRTHARARVTPYTGGPACTRALTDTWVPRSSAPSRHRCHRSRRARSSIRYCSSSPSFPARQKTAGHRAYWPHFSPDHSQQLTCTRARRPRSRPDPFRRTHTHGVSRCTAGLISASLSPSSRICHCRTHTYTVPVPSRHRRDPPTILVL